MEKTSVRKLIFCAVMTALVTVITMFPSIPMPASIGYVHLGDAVIYLSCVLIGPYAIISAGIGSMLSDLILGYGIFIPFTLVIKSIIALVAWLVVRKKETVGFMILATVLGSIVMIAGYSFTDMILAGSAEAGLASLIPNAIQAVAGIFVSTGFVFILNLSGARKRLDSYFNKDKSALSNIDKEK